MLTTESVRSRLPHDEAHPDHARWKRAVDAAVHRGSLVCTILGAELALRGASVLDLGCGVGGTSRALHAAGAHVTAADIHPARLAALRALEPAIPAEIADATALHYHDRCFDAVVLQDVIEHTDDPAAVLRECARVLRDDGVLYISTPARHALANLAADPHFGLPFASLLARPALRRVLARHRPTEAERADLAELLPMRTLLRLLAEAGLRPAFRNRAVIDVLFDDPRAVVWSDLHLRAIALLRRLHLRRVASMLASDTPGLRMALVVPTWYAVCRKSVR